MSRIHTKEEKKNGDIPKSKEMSRIHTKEEKTLNLRQI
jgi:hypothetical protein